MRRKRLITSEEAQLLDQRFQVMRANLDYVAFHLNRHDALYPMMDRTVYQDFETLVEEAIMDNVTDDRAE